MKKYLSAALASLVMLTTVICGFAADSQMSVLLQINNPMMYAGGTETEIDLGHGTVPVIENGRTLVPIRSIIEKFGGEVLWDGSTKTVTLLYSGDEISLTIDSETAYLNKTAHTLDIPPRIINDRTMLPIRFIAESFNLNVLWDSENSVISITNGGEAAEIPSTWLHTSAPVDNGTMKVHFIDVGQGDSIFIELPNGESMLLDAGPSSDKTANYIRGLGYGAVSYVIATHPDSDHITGMPNVLSSFAVGKFYMPEKSHTTQIFEQMLNSIVANGCETEYAFAGKTIVDTPYLAACFVAPNRIYDDNNESSAVVRLVYKNNSFLFTGDAEGGSEADMLDSGFTLSADVLKVGHHGSDSSTSDSFLRAVSPRYAVISCGAGNSYGHPTQNTLARLASGGISVFRTDEVGTIVFSCDGVNYSVDKLSSVINSNAPPEQQAASVQQEIKRETNSDSSVVYRTKTGKKYHLDGCSSLSRSKIPTTVSEAKAMGLGACQKCNPPQ